jgi:hypothetical protein
MGRTQFVQVLAKVLAAFHQDGISRGHLARILNLYQFELDQLLFGLVMTGIKGGRRTMTGNDSERPILTRVK